MRWLKVEFVLKNVTNVILIIPTLDNDYSVVLKYII